MRNWEALKKRYLRDELPIRLGGIASNLARIKTLSKNIAHSDTVVSLVEESKIFIEWTANDADIDTAGELVELQIQLALWQLRWTKIWADPAQRMEVAEQAQIWSDRILERSGLLD
jgi:ribosomal protein L29